MNDIERLLTRGVEDVIEKKHLQEQLESGKKLRIKLGFDPTGANIHIGRAISLWKLKAFQDLGHQVVFIVGDFTAQIGDPSDKLDKRPMITKEIIQENLTHYKEQVGKILDISNVEFVYNSEWLEKFSFKETVDLAESFTVQQMLSRRNFKNRFDNGQDISLREFLYPIMQGYDSVQVKADVEIGGFDQLFNLKAGRIIQKHYTMEPQDILTSQMLEGTDGRKMSTSWGNIITIVDTPEDIYGKTMSLRDELITKYFLLCTHVSEEDIEDIKKHIEKGENPKEFKMQLSRELVTMYHSKEAAEKAEENFVSTFAEKGIPENIEEVIIKGGEKLSDILVQTKITISKAECRRLFDAGAIHDLETNEVLKDPNTIIEKKYILRIGKKRFIKINIQ